MKLSRKKIMRACYVLDNNLIDSMKKYRVIEELKEFGVDVNENSSLDADTVRAIYKRLCVNLCKVHEKEIEDEISKGNYRRP